MPNILFVCAQNKLRSPTAELIFSRFEQLNCLSAGIHASANNPLDREALEWADLIFVMEKKHKTKIQQRFKAVLDGEKIIALNIPDEFDYMEPALIELLEKKIMPYLQPFL